MHWLGSPVHGLATRISPPAFAPQFPASWRSHESAVVIAGAARAGARTWPQRTPLLARPVGLSRAIRHPRLARCGGTLQADRDRDSVGSHSAFLDPSGLHNNLRPTREAAERRGDTLSAHGVRRHAAMVLVFNHYE